MRMWTGSNWLRTGTREICFECGNEPLDFTAERVVFGQLNEYRLLKQNSVPWSGFLCRKILPYTYPLMRWTCDGMPSSGLESVKRSLGFVNL
jgi:hypothetical protein